MELTAEQIDTFAAEVGNELAHVLERLEALDHTIDFGPEFTSEELEKAFHQLDSVIRLVRIALDLYPYPFERLNRPYEDR